MSRVCELQCAKDCFSETCPPPSAVLSLVDNAGVTGLPDPAVTDGGYPVDSVGKATCAPAGVNAVLLVNSGDGTTEEYLDFTQDVVCNVDLSWYIGDKQLQSLACVGKKFPIRGVVAFTSRFLIDALLETLFRNL